MNQEEEMGSNQRKDQHFFVFFFLEFLRTKENKVELTLHSQNAFLDFLCTSITMHVNLQHHCDNHSLQNTKTIEPNKLIRTKSAKKLEILKEKKTENEKA